ncbi:MAG: hypothetical protein ABSH52_13665 [Terriglobia bacterium]|jgi:hypothetical protein
MMHTLLLGAVTFACLHNVWALVNVLWSLRFLNCARITYDNHPVTRFILLLPMYQEAAIAKFTLSYFCSLDYPLGLVRIVVITTARERVEMGMPTTEECVKEWLAQTIPTSHSVLHVHTDGNDRCKADQLNAALRSLQSQRQGRLTPHTFIGVYDADSRPDVRVLRDVDRQIKQNDRIRAFQQGAVYFANWARLPSDLKGAYLRTRPFYNLRFWLYRELPGLARSVVASRIGNGLARALISSPNHFLGHGEFVRVDLLEALGGFPAPSGDTSLGTIISMFGIPIGPLVTYDVAETPSSIISLYHQGITWYSGCSLYVQDLQRAWHLGAKASLAQLAMCMRRWLENMIWCMGPLLLSIVLLLAATLHVWVACVVGSAACGLHAVTLLVAGYGYERFRMQIRTSPELPTVMRATTVISLLTLYPLMLLMCCLSPISYYCLRVRCAVTGKAVPRFKTSREH